MPAFGPSSEPRRQRTSAAAALTAVAVVAASVTLAAPLSDQSAVPEEDFRVLTSSDGRTVEARFVAAGGDEVTIETRDGQTFVLPLERLSEDDRNAAAAWRALLSRGGVSPSALNEAIGQPLANAAAEAARADTAGLWNEDPAEVAERLGWRPESMTPRMISFRSYPAADYRFLGARPFSVALYGAEDKVIGLSLVYANKGDFFSARGSAADHFEAGEVTEAGIEAFAEAMETDEKAIAGALREVLGEPTVQRFGEGEGRRRVERWDWDGHAFLLSSEEGEYVSLLIQPSAAADSGGKAERISDAAVRERIRANVERRENGDVVVTDIPMVDQGPKGYCVPATFERCMRYLDVPADMYLLAMAGQSGLGGGTSVERLIKAVERDARRKGRKFDSLSAGDFRFSRLAKYIDDGIPVIWALHSTPWFNQTADARTKARAAVSDWEAWKADMDKAASAAADREVGDVNGHVAIIVGYNEKTGEIAFSDSWGERFKERWITLDEAERHSQGRLYVIRP